MIFRLLTIAFLTFAALPAHAQTAATDSLYDSEGQPYGKSYYKKNAPGLSVALVRQPELGPEFFVLRLSSTENYTGCPKFSALPFEVGFNGNTLTVKIGKYTVDMRNLTSAPHYDCDTTSKVPSAEIPLSREDLKSRAVKTVRLESESGSRTYNLELTDTHVRFVPGDAALPGESYYRDQKIPGRRSSLIYWFYPADTVILSAPAAKPEENVTAALDILATQKGYARLDIIYPDFKSPLADSRQAYYVREKKEPVKKPAKSKKKKDAVIQPEPTFTEGPFGVITVNRPVYRLDQTYDQPTTIDVVARKPSSND